LVDIDELFDYPFSDVVSLGSLLGYLNERSYTAVVSHMLDMFPEHSIRGDAPIIQDDPLKEKYRFYDVSNVYSESYRLVEDAGNVISNEDIQILRGGIRQTLFGNKANLIKHPLIFLDDEIRPMDLSDHWVGNARIADFTGVLLHYKLSDRLYEDVRSSVEEQNRSEHGTRRYGRFLQVLEKKPELQIKRGTSKELESTDDLIRDGFVVVSGEYLGFVERVASDVLQDSGLRERLEKVRRMRAAPEADQASTDPLANAKMFSPHSKRLDVPNTPELEMVRNFLLRYDVEHLHGPAQIDYEKDELIVLCLLRNGGQHVRAFIEHYLSLGVKHLVFLDNGSTDGTVETLKEYENVTVLQTTVLFKRYQLLMRQYLVERFGKGRWSLLVDIDELFDYPFSDVVSLGSLLGYLNERSYTAVVSHMLDMFPEGSITDGAGREDAPLKELYRFYDLSKISVRDYQSEEGLGNAVSNDGIKILQGGVQKRLFNINPQLTKHPLIFHDGEIRPVDRSEHWAGAARLADFSGVLFHYKILGLHGLVRREVEERRYINRHGKYDKYLKALEESPNLTVKSETSEEMESANDLIGTNFNVVSTEYLDFVKKECFGADELPQDHQRRLARTASRDGSEIKSQRQDSKEPQERLRKLQEILRVESGRTRQMERRKENLEKRNENLEKRTGNVEKQNKVLKRNLRRAQQQNRVLHQQNLETQRQLRAELNEVRRHAQGLSVALNRMRSSRSWMFLDGLNKIRKALTHK
jgi:hypothetical protein